MGRDSGGIGIDVGSEELGVGSGAERCTQPVDEEGRDSGGVVAGATLEEVVEGIIGFVENGIDSVGINVCDVELTF